MRPRSKINQPPSRDCWVASRRQRPRTLSDAIHCCHFGYHLSVSAKNIVILVVICQWLRKCISKYGIQSCKLYWRMVSEWSWFNFEFFNKTFKWIFHEHHKCRFQKPRKLINVNFIFVNRSMLLHILNDQCQIHSAKNLKKLHIECQSRQLQSDQNFKFYIWIISH